MTARDGAAVRPDRRDRPVAADGPADRLVEVGERIERVLERGAPDSPVAREDARELVRLLTDLYGEALERVLRFADEAGVLNDDLLTRLAGDPLVGSVLLVHGLHPFGVRERVERALASVRPKLERHGAEAEAVVSDDGTVRVRVTAAGCGSEALVGTVRAAVEDAAPDADVEVDSETARSGAATFIPLETLRPPTRATVRT